MITPDVPPRSRRGDLLALALVAIAVVLFYGWTVSPEGGVWRQWGRIEEYYNSEVKGFRSGHLWMALAPPPQLQALADPYDPVQNAPYRLHDASYYRGHYYLYFGVTPAVLFFWPVKAVTGHYASELQAVLVFCGGRLPGQPGAPARDPAGVFSAAEPGRAGGRSPGARAGHDGADDASPPRDL